MSDNDMVLIKKKIWSTSIHPSISNIFHTVLAQVFVKNMTYKLQAKYINEDQARSFLPLLL